MAQLARLRGKFSRGGSWYAQEGNLVLCRVRRSPEGWEFALLGGWVTYHYDKAREAVMKAMRARRNPCARRNDGRGTTERKMGSALKSYLLGEGWTRDGVERIVGYVEGGLDGFWSYGTVRAIKDLAAFYKEAERRLGEPPDRRW